MELSEVGTIVWLLGGESNIMVSFVLSFLSMIIWTRDVHSRKQNLKVSINCMDSQKVMAINEVAISIQAETQEQIDRMESDETTNKVIASEVPAHIAIWIPDETQVQTPPAADPQFAPYFFVIYLITITMSVLAGLGPKIIQNKSQSTFEAHGGLFMIMTIASVSIAVLASGILIFASFFLQSWTKNIHYTVLKSVGIFFGLLALCSQITIISVPQNLNLVLYLVFSITVLLFLTVYYFLWKVVCCYQHKAVGNIFPWPFYLGVIPGLLNASLNYLPPKLVVQITIVCIAAYVVPSLNYLNKIIQERLNSNQSSLETLKKEEETISTIKEGNVEISQAILEERAKTVEDWYRKAADRARYKKQAVPITCTTFDQDVLEGRAKVSQAHDHKHQPLMFAPAASLEDGSMTSERERIAAQVFQPSLRMLTMSIEEAGLKEMEMMNTWQEQIAKMIEEANSSWHTDNKWKPRAGGGDDEAAQDKARAFDDWKDENPPGAGNSKLAPCGYFLHPISCH